MKKCEHCNKLIDSNHIYVTVKTEDSGKLLELASLQAWTPKYYYNNHERDKNPNEWGKLKCGDMYIHFLLEK